MTDTDTTQTPRQGDSEDGEDTLTSQELPRVVLGQKDSHAPPIKERVLPGRISLTPFGWAMTIPIGLSLLCTCLFAFQHRTEWSVWMVFLAWFIIWLWKWLYMEAWTYQRSIIKYLSAFTYLAMSLGLAFLLYDRAQPQEIWIKDALETRALQPSLLIASGLLILSDVVLIAHLVWFGRGWRKKKSRRGKAVTRDEETRVDEADQTT